MVSKGFFENSSLEGLFLKINVEITDAINLKKGWVFSMGLGGFLKRSKSDLDTDFHSFIFMLAIEALKL